jgi:formate/nitrite transporter FocA (FNT family)
MSVSQTSPTESQNWRLVVDIDTNERWVSRTVTLVSIAHSFILKFYFLGAREMAQLLRALTALPVALSSIPSNHTICNGIQCSFLVCLKTATVYSYIYNLLKHYFLIFHYVYLYVSACGYIHLSTGIHGSQRGC